MIIFTIHSIQSDGIVIFRRQNAYIHETQNLQNAEWKKKKNKREGKKFAHTGLIMRTIHGLTGKTHKSLVI